MKKNKKILISLLVIVAIIVIACAVYLNDYYRADNTSIEAFEVENNVSKVMIDDDVIAYEPENAIAGFVFYPGGKVEYIAYEPLMKELASSGVLCVLVKMPFNLAVFDVNAAEGIQVEYPDIEEWYIGGHSLGGSMAASYLKDNTDDYEGLVLLGSYSTTDLSNESLKILSIYGSEDKVLNMEKYQENKENLPEDFEEVIIEGGCHAYFGMYGEQDGDGKAIISNVEQIIMAADEIMKFIGDDNYEEYID